MSRLELRHFRNYTHQVLEPEPRLNLIVGPNAQGKSNLLEALFAVSSTRSVRTRREEEVIQWGQDFARVDARLTSGPHSLQAELTWAKAPDGPLHKTARVNRQDVRKFSELFGLARMVLFAADDLDLVTGAPGERRRFLDYLLSKISPAYLEALQHYHQVLQQRNRWLRQPRGSLKDVLDQQLLHWAATVVGSRDLLVRELSLTAARYYAELTRSPQEFALAYRPSLPVDGPAAERVLAARADEELRRATSLVGPHRDDVAVRLGGNPLRAFGSRGQMRCTALALRLAQGDLMQKKSQDSVVYLMDDCMSELDDVRQRYLWEHLLGREQVFMTGTPDSLNHRPQADIRIWTVDAGRLQPA